MVDEKLMIEHTADMLVKGHVGLWMKADSVTWFGPLTIDDLGGV